MPVVELVRGDIMLLAEGDRVAADAELLSGGELQVDESLLTGESVPVRKLAGATSSAVAPDAEVSAALLPAPWWYRGRAWRA